MEKKYLLNGEKVTQMEAHKLVEAECEEKWNKNQAKEYGEWYQQDDDTKATYYNKEG